MPVVGETGRSVTLWHRSTAAFTGGFTSSIDFNIAPANVSIHAGVSHVQATNQGPYGGSAGVKVFKIVGRPEVDLGNDPRDWAPLVYGRLASFTVAFIVVRGDLTGWVFFQVWN